MWGSLRNLPRPPQSCFCQMRRVQAVGWVRRCCQEKQAGEVGHRGWLPPLFRLASPKGVHLCKSPRPTQMFRVRKAWTWGSDVPSSREGLSPSPLTTARSGCQSSHALACSPDTPPSSEASQAVLTLVFQGLTTPIPPVTITPLSTSTLYIMRSWNVNLQLADTLAHSLANNWRPIWALSRPPPFPWSLRRPSQANIGWYTISPTCTTPCPMQRPSTPTSTAQSSHAPGALSPQSPSSLLASPQAPKPLCVKLQRLIGPSLSPHPNGPASSSACKQTTSLQSMCAIILASHQLGVYTGWLQMRVPTCSKATGSAHLPSGLTTTFSSESCAHSYQNTMRAVLIGTMKSVPMGATGRMAAGCGMVERTCQTDPRRSLMKTAVQSSKTWQMPSPTPQRTGSSPTLTQTSMRSQHIWEFDGRPPSLFPSRPRFPTSVSGGTCTRTSSPSSRTKGPDTWLPSSNGKAGVHTTFSEHKNYMESSSMHLWSCQQDALTSLAWRPCSLPSTITFSYCTPLPVTLRVILGGESSSLADPNLRGPSQSPAPLSTMTPIPTQALASEWQSRSAQDGGHGDWLLVGSPKVKTSNGPKPSVSNFSSSVYAHCLARASTSKSMETTEGSLRGGGRSPVPTNPPTASSATSSSYLRAAIGQYTQNTSQVHKTPPMPPPGANTLLPSSSLAMSPSLKRSGLSSSTSDVFELARRAALKRLVPTLDAHALSDAESRAAKRRKPLETRPRHLPIPPTTAPPHKRPAPYP